MKFAKPKKCKKMNFNCGEEYVFFFIMLYSVGQIRRQGKILDPIKAKKSSAKI